MAGANVIMSGWVRTGGANANPSMIWSRGAGEAVAAASENSERTWVDLRLERSTWSHRSLYSFIHEATPGNRGFPSGVL